jgi:Protein of unknown function (DUF4232)
MKLSTLRAAAVLSALSILVAGGSSPALAATHKRAPAKTTAKVAACPSSSVSATADFTMFGGSSSSVAGAVVFRNTGQTACSLRGVPRVEVLSNSGQVIPTFQAPEFTARLPTAVLTAGHPAQSAQAGSSFTISSWTCSVSSFSLTVLFPGWASSIPVAPEPSSGSCTASGEANETLYVGPVTAIES